MQKKIREVAFVSTYNIYTMILFETQETLESTW